MAKNALAKKIAEAKRSIQQFTMQLAFDLFAIAMRDAGLSEDKVLSIMKSVNESFLKYAKIWREDSNDKEYSMDVLDRQLKKLFPKNYIPWEKRYENII